MLANLVVTHALVWRKLEKNLISRILESGFNFFTLQQNGSIMVWYPVKLLVQQNVPYINANNILVSFMFQIHFRVFYFETFLEHIRIIQILLYLQKDKDTFYFIILLAELGDYLVKYYCHLAIKICSKQYDILFFFRKMLSIIKKDN